MLTGDEQNMEARDGFSHAGNNEESVGTLLHPESEEKQKNTER